MNTMIDKFLQSEIEGRKIFLNWCKNNNLSKPVFNQEKFGVYDADINGNIFEIKYKKNNFYKDWEPVLSKKGLLLEENKYNSLKEINAKRVFYFVIYEDNILVHRIDFDFNYTIEYYNCPKSTMGDNRIIRKRCKMIPLNKVKIFKTIK